jgi:hypothetical protein
MTESSNPQPSHRDHASQAEAREKEELASGRELHDDERVFLDRLVDALLSQAEEELRQRGRYD